MPPYDTCTRNVMKWGNTVCVVLCPVVMVVSYFSETKVKMEECIALPLAEEQLMHLIQQAKDFAVSHGKARLLKKEGNQNSKSDLVHVV